MDAEVKKFKDQFQSFQANSREAAGKRVGTDQHYRPHGRRVKGISDTHGVAENNISLKLTDLVEADYFVLECTEARGDSVCYLAAFKKSVDCGSGLQNVPFCTVG